MLSYFLHRFQRTSEHSSRRQPQSLRFEQLEGREVPATIYALLPGNTIARFDSATPGTIQSTVAVTGLGTNETLRGIDFRPRTGQLIGSTVTTGSTTSSIVTTYSINPLTGAATLIGATAAALTTGDVPTGYDFNPTVDRIRLVSTTNENARLNPNNGLRADSPTNDTDLTFTPLATGPIVASAYDRNTDRLVAGVTNPLPTTLYGIDRGSNMLVIQGGVNGTPSPNLGVVTPIGALGFTLDSTLDAGFDIMESTDNGGLGTAFTVFSVGGVARLYTVNLSTGAATLVGQVGSSIAEVYSIAAVPDSVVVVGSGLGANGDVRILDATTGAVRLGVVPFVGFQGGVRVAAGDVNRDGIPDAVVSAIAPQGHVKVFDGVTGAELQSFFAFQGFLGTVNVAAGDVNGDGFADVIVAANGANGHVKAFSGADGSLLGSFFAYQGFLGNVTVAAADLDKDGDDEIITAAASNGHVRVFNADGSAFTSASLPNFVNSFFLFQGFTGDVFVAAGDLNGDGTPDIAGVNALGELKAFNSVNGALLANFQTAATFSGDPRLPNRTVAGFALADANDDGRFDFFVTPGLGLQADVAAFDLTGVRIGTGFPAFANFLGGATIGGARF